MKQPPLLHHEITGHGPSVLLLHGYMGSGQYWNRVVAELSRTHRVITLDLLGFGRSPKPRCSRYDLEAQRQSIEATLARLNITEPLTVVGHSMGSLVALDYAARHKQRLHKVVLANMPVFRSPREARRDVYRTRALYRFALQPGLHAIIWPVFKAFIALRLLPAKLAGTLDDHRAYMFQSSRFARVRSMRNLIFKAGVEANLEMVRVQTTLLSGAYDRLVYLRNLQQLQLGQFVESFVVEGGHHLPRTNPQLIVRAVTQPSAS